MKIEIINFPKHGDERGALVVLEEQKSVPFNVKRIYYMFDTKKDVRRGFHAHKKLRQLAIPVQGHCKFLLDDGNESIEILVDNPTQGLMIEPMIWHEMFDYSENCVLMVLADDYYDESDYIRNYEEFKQRVTNG
ncbi:WxcM-like domain-containing protein [Cronobacter sakazakii]|uniref:FbtA n=1 Tax=Cronobacter sakazakii TaxID=28141 RepID=I1W277_CROSK|nr:MULTISPECIES: FdtA/QdtA family cupin domain-containing protein [Enterobacteriaceae]AFI60262.1 FbtA [Cronobacter sakazakii]AFI81921.1 FdtA [Cronobacter sakazakii]AXX02653.1 WxcM-like domain-containing protein [Cronobacter sakazakii]EGT4273468.1 WxcM-like domain-containing protein [Cronobacter sakazakii]EGT4306364.1 WxcM-like domain-containing protein [Cronobacter sakazakii]